MSQQVFLICPSTVDFHHQGFKMIKQFHPHLSMEDPPNLNSLLSPSREKTASCTSSHQGGPYQDPSLINEYCRKDTKEKQQSVWQFPGWEDVDNWIKSELSLNLYQYIN